MEKQRLLLGVLVLTTGCMQLPSGPSVAVMPAPGKPFDLFVNEEGQCRHYAEQQTGLSPQQGADQSLVTGAGVGTVVGAAAGTAIGAAVGHVGTGAMIGGATGMFEGSAIGAGNGYRSAYAIQQRYDIAYEQCMYAKGNQIPGFPVVYSPSAVPPPPLMAPPR